jgi:acyl transferase domain-containing protein
MSCRFPGASSTFEFWENIVDGVNSIIRVPTWRSDADFFFNEKMMTKSKTNSKLAGFVDDIQGFDRKFFGISA